MAKAIMIQGTASNSGKTLLAAALCRILQQDGYRVVPFKSQNMALNSYITDEGLEMGRAQVMQAEAAKVTPDVRMNPVLLKPTSDRRSEVIVHGKSLGTMSAKEYFSFKKKLLPDIQKAYETLASDADIVVIEGAGSPVEINLKSEDIVNMGMAALAKAPVLIVGDIDRGGVFASLLGTMLLLTEEERELVKGVVVNKFRGDVDILLPGLSTLADMIQVPVLGVVPFLDVKIDDEDSLADKFSATPEQGLVDMAVIHLPRMTNFTDFAVFEYMEGVSLRYVRSRKELGSPDIIFLPGTKGCLDAMRWLRESGLGGAVARHACNKPIIGISDGMALLGTCIGEARGPAGEGLGLLPFSTTFLPDSFQSPDSSALPDLSDVSGLLSDSPHLPNSADSLELAGNTQRQCKGCFPQWEGFFKELSALPYEGYIMGKGTCDFVRASLSDRGCAKASALKDVTGANKGEDASLFVASGYVLGSRVHGIFDNEKVAKALVSALLRKKGLCEDDITSFDLDAFKQSQYDILADAVRKSIDMKRLYEIIEEGV